jgi:predicted nucleotidyltransferase
MFRIPDQPQDIFVPLTQDYLGVFGHQLISLTLYGSAAAGAYVKGQSDINVLVVLTDDGMNRLDGALGLVKKWRKRNVAVPLVMTKEFIFSSLDAYPIEFLNMKSNSMVIYGEHILEQLTFKPEDLRLQIERELKSKVLLLREGYLGSEGASRELRNLIGRSLTAVLSIFNALIYLKTGSTPRDKRATINEMSSAFGICADVFFNCLKIKEKTDKWSKSDVTVLFKNYLKETERVSHLVDNLTSK